jgi:hypothetical protein
MSARQKLNAAFVRGGLLLAAAVGALARSWTVFALAATALIVLGLLGGDLRPGPRRR